MARIYKSLTLLVLCINIAIHVWAQQVPNIDVRSPIVLKLDAAGYHDVKLNELATITNPTDSPMVVKYLPTSFNCSTSGSQVVSLTAITNGSVSPSTPKNVRFNLVNGVCFDRAGNLFTTELDSYIIRKITPLGEVTIFAGTGVRGNDDGPGNKASFFSDGGSLIRDSVDNLYLADNNNGSIRKITPDGVVSTFKRGFKNPKCIAFDKHENLYVADEGSHSVFKVTPQGKVTSLAGNGNQGDIDGVGSKASFLPFLSIAVDASDNVYVGNNDDVSTDKVKIRKITQEGVVSTFFDPGKLDRPGVKDPLKAFYVAPTSLKFDAVGNLFIGDAGMLKILRPDGSVSRIVGTDALGYVDAQGTNARLWTVASFDFDPCGNIMVADQGNNVIRKITRAGVVSTYAGGGANAITGNIGASTCVGAAAAIPVSVQSTPVFTSTFGDVTLDDCANLADYTLKATVTDNCPDSRIKITQSPAPNSPMENNVPVTVTLTATDKTGGSASVSFVATAKYEGAPPGRSVQVTASSASVCAGEAVKFTADVVNAGPGTSYQWLVNDELAGPDAPEFTTSDLKDGDVVNCAATTANGCGIPNIGLPVIVSVNPIPTVRINNPAEIILGSSTRLEPVVTGDIVSYAWSPAEGLSDAASQYPQASPEKTTTYHLTVTSSAGCPATADVTVNVVTQVNAPNTFTPNGDGVNDLWSIAHLDNYPNCTVNVYNRNGALVFQSKGYPKAWNGTVNGIQIPSGVYYYIIDLKDGSEPKRGAVTVIR